MLLAADRAINVWIDADVWLLIKFNRYPRSPFSNADVPGGNVTTGKEEQRGRLQIQDSLTIWLLRT
jgi:hypothetical protein